MEISAKLSDLKITHPAYDLNGILDRQALYDGGELFAQRKENFLRVRKADVNPDYKQGRLKALTFSPRLANVLSTIAGACIRSAPKIHSDADFYKSLNENATDEGDNIATVAYRLIVESEVQKRAYLAVSFDEKNNPKLSILNALTVDKWGRDDLGRPWYRTYTADQPVNMSGAAGANVHRWKYFTADFAQEFTFIDGQPQDYREPTATPGPRIPNDMGYAPIWPMRSSCYMMGQLSSLFIDRLNRQCGISYLLDCQAFSVAVLNCSGNIDNVFLSEINGIKLTQPGESFSFVAPSAEMSTVQANDLAMIDREIYAGLQGFSGADIKDAQRVATGVMASATVGLKGILLRNMGSARDCLNAALDCIAEIRGEKTAPKIDGLDDCDCDSVDEKIARILDVQNVQNFPISSRGALLTDLASALTPKVSVAKIESEVIQQGGMENASRPGIGGSVQTGDSGGGDAPAKRTGGA